MSTFKSREIFPTLVLEADLFDFAKHNERLRQRILNEAEQDAGVQRSIVGGWQSRGDLFTRDWPELPLLGEEVLTAANELLVAYHAVIRPRSPSLKMNAWANVCREGDFHRPHSHPGATLSGVYYVDVGPQNHSQALCGILELYDPRPSSSVSAVEFGMAGQRELILPRSGVLVLFPSTVVHYVNVCRGGTRISLGINIHVEPASSGTVE